MPATATPSFQDQIAENPKLANAVAQFAAALNPEVIKVDPEQGEADDSPVFVKNGFIRWQFVGNDGASSRTLTLRRPRFGELKDLRLALEAAEDEVAKVNGRNQAMVDDDAVRALRNDRRITAINDELNDQDGDLTDEQVDELLAERRKLHEASAEMLARHRAGATEIRHVGDRIRIEWLTGVLDMLCIDDVPEGFDWPAWAANPAVVRQFMDHWRSVPLARG